MKTLVIKLNGEGLYGLNSDEFNQMIKLGFKYEVSKPKDYETDYLIKMNDKWVTLQKKVLRGVFENEKEILNIIYNLKSIGNIEICRF